jgi:hypothetical protein
MAQEVGQAPQAVAHQYQEQGRWIMSNRQTFEKAKAESKKSEQKGLF